MYGVKVRHDTVLPGVALRMLPGPANISGKWVMNTRDINVLTSCEFAGGNFQR
jgi:hypothetical protein